MNSPHQREQLPDLLCDALSPTQRARVESHLAGCEQCARELRALQAMQQSLAALPAATPPARVRANVRAALHQNQKPRWTWLPLGAQRAGARQVAWGGAVALSAIGLMLLARPSLQNDSLNQSAPVSETEIAANASKNAAPDSTGAAKKPGAKKSSKVAGNAKPNPSVLPEKRANGRPDSSASLPPLPPPPSASSIPPRTRIKQPETLAPVPQTKTPSSELFPEIAPKPTRVTPTRPGAPAAKTQAATKTQSPALSQSKLPTHKPAGRVVAPQQVPASPNAENQDAAFSAQAPETSGNQSAISGAGTGNAPLADRENARARERDDNASAAFAPPRLGRIAPAPAMQRQALDSSDWAGGAVGAQLKRVGKTPVLTLSVAIAIGNARLFLLLPNGESQVWRGSMNAAPVEIKLPELAGQVRSGQKIRARLEQIDSEGNPKSSTLFDLLWP